jgi:hypothetical protein
MSFPVVEEIWSVFEATLLAQSKKLVEDIAKKQQSDPKELWNKVRQKIKLGQIESDLPDPIPQLCPFYTGNADGCFIVRCRKACLLGFDRCPEHIHKPVQPEKSENPVRRIYDFQNKTYFVDQHGIAFDKMENPVGTVEDDELKLFEITSD